MNFTTKRKENTMKNDINITVSGTVNSGKSTIIALIKKALKDSGIEVNHDTIPDYDNEQKFDEIMQNLSKRADVVKGISSVSISERIVYFNDTKDTNKDASEVQRVRVHQ